MTQDPEILAHQQWLGYVQPVGLVVSPIALAAAQAYPEKNIIPEHARFLDCVEPVAIDGETDPSRQSANSPGSPRPCSAGGRPTWSERPREARCRNRWK